MNCHATEVLGVLGFSAHTLAASLPAATVIEKLSVPGVGYGVFESPVDSGNVFEHPVKRTRTPGTYLTGS